MRRPQPSSQAGKSRREFVLTAQSKLRTNGVRWTRARALVVDAVAGATRPLNAYGIRSEIASAGGNVDVVTVYRALSALAEAGLVHWVGVAEGYLACRIEHDGPGQQQYVYCPECGLVREIPIDPASLAAVKRSVERLGEAPTAISLEVAVKCGDCAGRSNEEGFRVPAWGDAEPSS